MVPASSANPATPLAIIGGTGVDIVTELKAQGPLPIDTPYGRAEVYSARWGERPVYFLPRHGAGHVLPPHRVPYRANIWALRHLGVERILATNACGSLRKQWLPGQLVVIDQFIDFTKNRPATFFDGDGGKVIHTDVTEPYCPVLREALIAAAGAEGVPIAASGCYVCTEGPRYETAAEIRFFQGIGGDLVGMTGVPEVTLAREVGICYAALGLVTNLAAGLGESRSEPISHQEVTRLMQEQGVVVWRLLRRAIELLPPARAVGRCPCTRAEGQGSEAG